MDQKIDNRLKGCNVGNDYVGGNQTKNYYNMFQDSEREFVVTHNANIKPVSYFTGREVELQELRQRIEAGRKSVLVSGMGGIGKTHICRKLFEEYVEKHANDENVPFHHIGYIEYSEDIGNSLQNGLKYKQQENPEANHEAAWKELEYLASDGKLLLFVDNVDKPMREDAGLQRLNSIPGALILTSRQASFSDEFEPYRIGFLSTEQCKEIYEKIRFDGSGGNVKPEEVQNLMYIIETLAGRHTITVEFLAHLARTKLWTVKRLREELEQKGFRLQFRKNGELINIQEEYEKLYDLFKLTEAEQNILEAFSVFPYIPLSAETCNEWLLSDAGVSEDDDMLMGLYQKGWLEFELAQESYVMHPVFARFIYGKRRPNAEKHLGLIKTCQGRIKIPDDNYLLECKKYLPFAESIIEKIDMEKSMEQVGFINMIALLLKCSGEYKEAERWFNDSLEICEEILEEDNCDIAYIYDCLGQIYSIQGEYRKGKEMYEKSLSIHERVLGENHKDTIVNYSNLASIYMRLHEYKRAEELFRKSLSLYEKTYEENESEIAIIYNELGGLYRTLGRFDKAEELYKKSLRIQEKLFGEYHLLTAIGYRNLAGVYLNTWRYKEAEGLYEKSLSICERVIGEDHPDTAVDYNNLAVVYFRTLRLKEAETYSLKAYKIGLDKLGSSHPNTQQFYKNVKISYFKGRIVIFNRNAKFKQWLEEKLKEE